MAKFCLVCKSHRPNNRAILRHVFWNQLQTVRRGYDGIGGSAWSDLACFCGEGIALAASCNVKRIFENFVNHIEAEGGLHVHCLEHVLR